MPENFRPGRSVLLDSNILFSLFHPREEHRHASVRVFLDNTDRDLVVLWPVVVETWGLMVGSRKLWHEARKMLEWVFTERVIVREFVGDPSCLALMNRVRVDLVDILLAVFADQVAKGSSARQVLPILTLDTVDFWRVRKAFPRMRICLLNMETDEIEG